MICLKKIAESVWIEFSRKGLPEDIAEFYFNPLNQETHNFEAYENNNKSSIFVRQFFTQCANRTYKFTIHNCGWFNLPYRLYEGWSVDGTKFINVGYSEIRTRLMSLGHVTQITDDVYTLQKFGMESYSCIETFIFRPYPKES